MNQEEQRVEIFESHRLGNLQEDVNCWLRANPNIRVASISTSSLFFPDTGSHYVLTVLYSGSTDQEVEFVDALLERVLGPDETLP